MQEFREAVTDVVDASRTMVAEQRAEDEAIAAREAEDLDMAAEEEAPLPPPGAGTPSSQGGANQTGTAERPTP